MSLYEIKKKLATLMVFEKATYAMKIVSSSLHTKIKKNLLFCQQLKQQLYFLKENSFKNTSIDTKRKIYLFIGAERGFCGDYNIGMMRKFYEVIDSTHGDQIPCILVGKAFIDKIKKKTNNLYFFPEFKERFFSLIQKKIIKILEEKQIELIEIFSYESKSIGSKELVITRISPKTDNIKLKNDYFIGHFSELSIIKKFQELYIETLLNYIFRMAFLTEQGIRFTSMDTALKNTREAIIQHQKLYFKTRQENINNQLQDLGVSLLL